MNLQILFSTLLLALTTGVFSKPTASRRDDNQGNFGYDYGVSHPAGSSRVHMKSGSSPSKYRGPSAYSQKPELRRTSAESPEFQSPRHHNPDYEQSGDLQSSSQSQLPLYKERGYVLGAEKIAVPFENPPKHGAYSSHEPHRPLGSHYDQSDHGHHSSGSYPAHPGDGRILSGYDSPRSHYLDQPGNIKNAPGHGTSGSYPTLAAETEGLHGYGYSGQQNIGHPSSTKNIHDYGSVSQHPIHEDTKSLQAQSGSPYALHSGSIKGNHGDESLGPHHQSYSDENNAHGSAGSNYLTIPENKNANVKQRDGFIEQSDISNAYQPAVQAPVNVDFHHTPEPSKPEIGFQEIPSEDSSYPQEKPFSQLPLVGAQEHDVIQAPVQVPIHAEEDSGPLKYPTSVEEVSDIALDEPKPVQQLIDLNADGLKAPPKQKYVFVPSGPPYTSVSHATEIIHAAPHSSVPIGHASPEVLQSPVPQEHVDIASDAFPAHNIQQEEHPQLLVEDNPDPAPISHSIKLPLLSPNNAPIENFHPPVSQSIKSKNDGLLEELYIPSAISSLNPPVSHSIKLPPHNDAIIPNYNPPLPISSFDSPASHSIKLPAILHNDAVVEEPAVPSAISNLNPYLSHSVKLPLLPVADSPIGDPNIPPPIDHLGSPVSNSIKTPLSPAPLSIKTPVSLAVEGGNPNYPPPISNLDSPIPHSIKTPHSGNVGNPNYPPPISNLDSPVPHSIKTPHSGNVGNPNFPPPISSLVSPVSHSIKRPPPSLAVGQSFGATETGPSLIPEDQAHGGHFSEPPYPPFPHSSGQPQPSYSNHAEIGPKTTDEGLLPRAEALQDVHEVISRPPVSHSIRLGIPPHSFNTNAPEDLPHSGIRTGPTEVERKPFSEPPISHAFRLPVPAAFGSDPSLSREHIGHPNSPVSHSVPLQHGYANDFKGPTAQKASFLTYDEPVAIESGPVPPVSHALRIPLPRHQNLH